MRIDIEKPARKIILTRKCCYSLNEIGGFFGVTINAVQGWLRRKIFKADVTTTDGGLKQYQVDSEELAKIIRYKEPQSTVKHAAKDTFYL